MGGPDVALSFIVKFPWYCCANFIFVMLRPDPRTAAIALVGTDASGGVCDCVFRGAGPSMHNTLNGTLVLDDYIHRRPIPWSFVDVSRSLHAVHVHHTCDSTIEKLCIRVVDRPPSLCLCNGPSERATSA